MKHVLALLLVFCGMQVAQAQAYTQAVQTPPVDVQYINGSLRFCEKENRKGLLCVGKRKFFGKTLDSARDWWHPETYVQYRTGLNEFTLYSVEPGPHESLVIHFSP